MGVETVCDTDVGFHGIEDQFKTVWTSWETIVMDFHSHSVYNWSGLLQSTSFRVKPPKWITMENGL